MNIEKKSQELWFVYMLVCTNDKIYTGMSTNVQKRFRSHARGRGAKFTKRNPPQNILALKACTTRSEAAKLEWAIKKLRRQQKVDLAATWNAQEGE
jgi:putative endonuclease